MERTGKRHQTGFGRIEIGQSGGAGGLVEAGQAIVVEAGLVVFDRVGGLSGFPAVRGGQAGELGHESGQAALAAEILDPQTLQVLKRQGLVEARGALPDQALKLGDERGCLCHLIHLGFGQLRQLLEAVLFAHGHVGQHLAVKGHAGPGSGRA
jgi:hypothetical protein